MVSISGPAASLERWAPGLFGLAGLLILVGAANKAMVFLVEGYTFVPALALARYGGLLVALLGTVGLYSPLRDRTPRSATGCLIVAGMSFVLGVVLVTWASATIAGRAQAPAPFLMTAPIVLSAVTFVLFGITIVRTDAHPAFVGGLLLLAAGGLLLFVSEPEIGSGRTVGLSGAALLGFPGLLVLGIGVRLWTATLRTR